MEAYDPLWRPLTEKPKEEEEEEEEKNTHIPGWVYAIW